MSLSPVIPETKVLAIASHVAYGYVGNTMAILVLQTLGCEVAAVNTVQFSNHTGYRQFKGTKAAAEEITELYDGLKQNYLTDFDIMLSGYAPILDPVMGDDGRIYVSDEVVPAYKTLLRDADLILPNQFEAELLSEVKITSLATLRKAITELHKEHRIPHIIVTSVRFDLSSPTISIIGSTARSDLSPRLFKIDVPAIDCFFSGTGDMFAALTIVRLREAVAEANLMQSKSWLSPDDVRAIDLPLARAAEKVLGSMQTVLEKTKKARDEALVSMGGPLGALEKEKGNEKRVHLRKTKAAEVRLVRNLGDLRDPKIDFQAHAPGLDDDNVQVAEASAEEMAGENQDQTQSDI